MQISEYKNIFEHEDSHFFYKGTHRIILEILDKYLSKKKELAILDAGCGTGLLLKKLKKFGQVYGIDISNEALKFAKKRGIKNLYQASVTKLPFADKKFDLVLSIDVLYHQNVSSDQKALRELYRVLKPEGLLIVKVPAFNWLRGNHDLVVQTKHRYTINELKKKLESSNFKIKKISYLYIFIFPILVLKRLGDKLFPKQVSSEINEVPKIINKIFLWLITLEARIVLFSSLPFGVSILAVAKKNN